MLDRALGWLGERVQDFVELFRANALLQRVAIGVLVVVALVLVVRWVIEWRTAVDEAADGDAPARTLGGSPWRAAQRAAADGRFDVAAHALVEAVITALAAQGAVRAHPSKTIGDYARDLAARRHPQATPFRAMRRHYERCIYGDRRVTAEDYAALRAMAEPMVSPRAAAA